MEIIRTLWFYTGAQKWRLLVLPLLVCAIAALNAALPYFMGEMVNKGVAVSDMEAIVKNGIYMVVISFLIAIFGLLSSYINAHWSMGVVANMRKALFNRVMTMPFPDADKYGRASLLNRLSSDMGHLGVISLLRSTLSSPMMIAAIIVTTITVYKSVSILFVVVGGAFLVIVSLASKRALRHYRKMFKKNDDMTNVLNEDLIGSKTVRAFARESYESERFSKKVEDLTQEAIAAQRITVLMDPMLHLVMNIAILAVISFCGPLIVKSEMLPGDLLCIISYTSNILVQVFIISTVSVPLMNGVVSLKRVLEVLKDSPSIENVENAIKTVDGSSIEFKNVSFGYYKDEDKTILKNVSFSVKPGETIGVIGSSGSGKTSLVNLISRFYDVQKGSVEIAGVDVRKYDLDALRKSIGLVPQHSVLFSGTVKQNLLWGNENASDKEIVDACVAANANDFVMGFADGYNTAVGQGGSTVSGGQRQRLCIARALLKKPRILIFDDSLSAVDNATEDGILHSLSQNLKDTTVVIVAQKISSLRTASRIVVLNNGFIDAVGTHEELLQVSKVYREIYESQKKNIGA